MSDIRLAVAAVSIGVLVAMLYLGGMTVAPLSTILFGPAR